MTAAMVSKLAGIADNANNYSLPVATSSARGGIKIGYTTSGKNYAVQLNNEQAYVSVPWQDTHYKVTPVLASTATLTTNNTTATGNVATYINLVENSAVSGHLQIKGSGATTVSAVNGILTISSTNTVDLTSMTGTLAVAHGGTGATTAADARTNLGLGLAAIKNLSYTTSGRYYAVQSDDNNNLYVNVPWVNDNTTYTVGTATYSGTTRLYTSAGTNTDGTLTQKAIGSIYAPLASPTLTGTPTAPTAAAGTNTTQVATTAFVKTAVTNGTSDMLTTTVAKSTYVSQTYADSTYAKKTDIAGMYKYKGTVATVDDLPTTGNVSGDVYNVEARGVNYAWVTDSSETSGGYWDNLGELFSVPTVTNTEIDTILAS